MGGLWAGVEKLHNCRRRVFLVGRQQVEIMVIREAATDLLHYFGGSEIIMKVAAPSHLMPAQAMFQNKNGVRPHNEGLGIL